MSPLLWSRKPARTKTNQHDGRPSPGEISRHVHPESDARPQSLARRGEIEVNLAVDVVGKFCSALRSETGRIEIPVRSGVVPYPETGDVGRDDVGSGRRRADFEIEFGRGLAGADADQVPPRSQPAGLAWLQRIRSDRRAARRRKRERLLGIDPVAFPAGNRGQQLIAFRRQIVA